MYSKLLFSMLFLISLSYSQNRIIAHWSFDSTLNQTYYDNTGNNYDAMTLKGATLITAGLKGNSLNCTSDSFLTTVQNSSSQFNFPQFSIEGWIYSNVDLVNPGSFFNSHHIFTTQTWIPSGDANGYEISIDDRGKFHLAMADSSGSTWVICTSDSVLKPRTWYHVAGVYNDSTMKVYINGRLAGSTIYTSGYYPSNSNAVIGCQMSADSSQWRNWLNGKIDELKLYNYALNAQSILNSYNELKPSEKIPFEINFGLKTTHAQPGDTVIMPIFVTNFEDYAINACEFNMKFDSRIVDLLAIEKDSGIISNWPLYGWNKITTDSISIAMAGTTTPVKYGEGEFTRCIFRVKPDAQINDTCSIKLSNISIDENYHLVTATSKDGKIIINNTHTLYGDVTGNKEVNVFDAQSVLSYVVGALTLPDLVYCPNFTVAVADVSGNGSITSYDAALIFQHSVGLLPEFPVALNSQKRLQKQAITQFAPIAQLTARIENIANNELRCTIIGSNLKGFVAGELSIGYDPAIVTPSHGSITTSIRGATLNSRVDVDNRLLKVAIVTNDDIDENDPVTLVSIKLPPVSGNPQTAFSIIDALINEGKMSTNIGSAVKLNQDRSQLSQSAALNLRVMFSGRNLTIISTKMMPAEICIWALNAKTVSHRKIKELSYVKTVSLSSLASGSYYYQVKNGQAVLRGRLVITY